MRVRVRMHGSCMRFRRAKFIQYRPPQTMQNAARGEMTFVAKIIGNGAGGRKKVRPCFFLIFSSDALFGERVPVPIEAPNSVCAKSERELQRAFHA